MPGRLLAHDDPEAAAKIVIERGLSVRQSGSLGLGQAAEKASRETARDPETEALERDLSDRLGLAVHVAFDGKGGAVTIKYRSLDQLDGLVALLSSVQGQNFRFCARARLAMSATNRIASKFRAAARLFAIQSPPDAPARCSAEARPRTTSRSR